MSRGARHTAVIGATIVQRARCRHMKPLATVVLCALVAALAAAAPALAAPTTIAALDAATEVRAYAGVQVWSTYDPASKRHHLTVRRDAKLSTPAIGSSKIAIEADVGPGPGGRPALAYVRCTDACRVVVTRLDGSGRQVVRGSAGASDPTISGRQVAWVRGKATVMTSTVDGQGRKRLAGAPRRKCYETAEGHTCERPRSVLVSELELHGSQLALVADFELPGGFGSGEAELRTESIKGGPQRLVAWMTVGEGGQSWIGPSWARGRLYYYKTCFGDPSGCATDAGVYRFDPVTGKRAIASSSTVLTGFAIDDDGTRAYTASVPGFDGECRTEDAVRCLLRRTSPLRFKQLRR